MTNSAESSVMGKAHDKERMLGRSEELGKLMDGLERVTTGSSRSECIVVHGLTGVGKTCLLETLDASVEQTLPQNGNGNGQWECVRISFPPFSTEPMETIWKLLIQLCLIVLRKLPDMQIHIKSKTESKTEAKTGQDKETAANHLLSRLLRGERNGQNVLRTVCKRLMRLVASSSLVLLCLVDDWQNADEESRQVLESIVREKLPRVFVVGAYRNNSGNSTNIRLLVDRLLDSTASEEEGCRVSLLHIGNLSPTHTQELITRTLDQKEPLPSGFIELLYKKTMGNPLWTLRLLRVLQRDRLIHQDELGAWKWDGVAIRQIRLASDDAVLDFLVNEVSPKHAVHRPLRIALTTAAHLGRSFRPDILAAILLPQPRHDIIVGLARTKEIVDLAVREKLLYPVPGSHSRYAFVHDKMHEAFFKLIRDDDRERQLYFWEIAHPLCCRFASSDSLTTEVLFTIAYCLSESMSILLEKQELLQDDAFRWSVVDVLLQASEHCMKRCAPAPAERYMEDARKLAEGVYKGSLLWQHRYGVALQLHSLLAHIQCATGRMQQCRATVETIVANANQTLDKLAAHQLSLSTYDGSDGNEWDLAVVEGLDVLRLLDGIDAKLIADPTSLTRQAIHALQKYTDKQILTASNVKTIQRNRPNAVATMHILYSVSSDAFLIGQSNACDVASFYAFRYALERVVDGGSKAYALMSGGIALIASGHLKEGVRCSRLAIHLAKKANNAPAAAVAQAIGMAHCFGLHWRESIRTLIKPVSQSLDTLLPYGDVGFLCVLASSYAAASFLTGTPLNTVVANLGAVQQTIEADFSNRLSQLSLMRCHSQFALNLIGASDYRFELLGEAAKADSAYITGNEYSLQTYHLLKLQLAVFFGHWEKADVLASTMEGANNTIFQTHFNFYVFQFFAGLTYWERYRQTSKRTFSRNAQRCMEILTRHANDCPNVGPLLLFLRAEEEAAGMTPGGGGRLWLRRRKGNTEPPLYEKAIDAANRADFVSIACLAHERYASYILSAKKKSPPNQVQARHHVLKSITLYGQWQAYTKVQELLHKHEQLAEPKSPLSAAKTLLGNSYSSDERIDEDDEIFSGGLQVMTLEVV